MSVKTTIAAIPLTTFNSASVTASYQPINSGGLNFSCILLRVNNASNAAITISYDGVTDHEYIQAAGLLEIQAQANSLPSPNACCFKRGTIIYLKGTAGVGTIALSGYYQPQGG